MSQRLTPVSRTELISRFRRLGWEGPHSGKNHQYMKKGKLKAQIPNPHKHKDIEVGLLRLILADADISRDEWLNA